MTNQGFQSFIEILGLLEMAKDVVLKTARGEQQNDTNNPFAGIDHIETGDWS